MKSVFEITVFGLPVVFFIIFVLLLRGLNKKTGNARLNENLFDKILEWERNTGNVFKCRKCKHFNEMEVRCYLLDKKVFNLGPDIDDVMDSELTAMLYLKAHEKDLIEKLFVPCANKNYEELEISPRA